MNARPTITKQTANKMIAEMNGLQGFKGGAKALIATVKRVRVNGRIRYVFTLVDGIEIRTLAQWRQYSGTASGFTALMLAQL